MAEANEIRQRFLDAQMPKATVAKSPINENRMIGVLDVEAVSAIRSPAFFAKRRFGALHCGHFQADGRSSNFTRRAGL